MKKQNTLDWDAWLLDYETKLKSKGFAKYNQKYKHEDFAYWKTIEGLYQIGVLFYDVRPFGEQRIGTQFECSILTKERIDLSVTMDISIEDFEIMAQTFFNTLG